MDYGIYAGDTDKTIYLELVDSTTGLSKTGLAYNSSGVVFSYTLPLAARVAITPATQTVTGAHSDGGFVEVDATNAKGLYRLDLPDAAIASGVFTIVTVQFTGVKTRNIFIPLHNRKVQLANGVTHGGATALMRLGSSSTTPALYVTNSGGDAVQFASSGNDGNGLKTSGNGTGDGLHCASGSGGTGIHANATGAGSVGFLIEGVDAGISASGSGAGSDGIAATGVGNGLRLNGAVDLLLDSGGAIENSTGNVLAWIWAVANMTTAGMKRIADFVLRRNTANAAASTETGLDTLSFRSPIGAVRKLTNHINTTATAGKLTIMEEDDATPAATQTLATDASAEPITGANTD